MYLSVHAFAISRMSSIGFLGTLAKDAQFKFTHRSFETKKKTVVEMAGLVDSFVIDDDSFSQDAEIDEMVPVTVVAGEAGGFEGEDSASFTVANGIEQAGKAGAFGATPLPEIPKSSSMMMIFWKPSCLALSWS